MKSKSSSLSYLAFQKFKQNKLGVLSFYYILFCGFIAIFAYFIAPDNSSNANTMHVEIHSKNPGFKVKLLEIPSANQSKTNSFWHIFLYGKENTSSEIPILNYNLKKNYIEVKLYHNHKELAQTKSFPIKLFKGKPIRSFIKTKTFYFGTDKYGRDVLSRLIIGTRISFFIGFVAVFISLVIGLAMGAIAGYYGGKTDAIIMWIINVTWSIPTLLLVIAITLALGKGFWQVFIAVGLTMWVEVARITRGQILSLKNTQYIEAAKVLGFDNFRIITKHLLPNILAPIIVISAANFAASILIESGLSFLGIGAQPPTPSWGAMIKNHYNYIILGKAYLAVIPGLAIMSLVMAFMLIGNALRDALDVKN
ncbi:MAG: ABC transporter permease [Lutibacter sp.]